MNTELKLKIFVNLFLWLPIIWFAWNQTFRIMMGKKRIKILDQCNALLKKLNKLNKNPNIDENNSMVKKLRQEEKRLWGEYERLQAYL